MSRMLCMFCVDIKYFCMVRKNVMNIIASATSAIEQEGILTVKRTFFCVDLHTCGMPVRVVAGGAPQFNAETIQDKWQIFKTEFDWVRKALMFEPRGHDAMSGTILYPAISQDCDVAVIFVETSGSLPMCGHGTIGTVTAIVEQGLLAPKTPGQLVLETPAGPVTARYEMDGENVSRVTLSNVASYVACRNVPFECPELGSLKADIAYGGNFYAIIEPQPGYEGLEALDAEKILRWSPAVRDRINASVHVAHPENETISGVSHIQWADKFHRRQGTKSAHSRNAVFFGSRGIDRSPCGTGTSARMAHLVSTDRIGIGETFVHESFIGSRFVGCARAAVHVGLAPAIRPVVAGTAHLTGLNTIFVDDRDPYREGFSLF